MDDAIGKIKVIPDHFKASTTSVDSHQNRTSSFSQQSDKFLEVFYFVGKKVLELNKEL